MLFHEFENVYIAIFLIIIIKLSHRSEIYFVHPTTNEIAPCSVL